MMNFRRAGLLLLCFIFFSRIVGFLLFSNGFLLKRVVIPSYSVCHLGPADHSENHFRHTCDGRPRPFKRVVWMLIDALRYDFLVYEDGLDPVPHYRNKMPFVRDLLRAQPRHAKLFRFVADPPTSTMPRLKALTTGGLPTFIDVSSNFNSHEILEDSLLHQARSSGRNVTFMGDDTWLSLYPNALTKAYDFPSFNVKDLHTVDDGVMEHLLPELAAYDADLVVGHFLGVDHVGHTYGPAHYTMAEKLTQMDGVLKSVFSAVDDDTVVFVMGDHGMTNTGDHGGEAELETDAGLLVYSKRPLFSGKETVPRSVYQVDIVPTTALLIGMPIPFSSIGMVIPELFLPPPPHPSQNSPFNVTGGFEGYVTLEFLDVLTINARQVHNYLHTYQQHAADFPPSIYTSLEEMLGKAEMLHRRVLEHGNSAVLDQAYLTSVASAFVVYMKHSKAMCQQVWAQFEDVLINKGIAILCGVLCTNTLVLVDVGHGVLSLGWSVSRGFAVGVLMELVHMLIWRPSLEQLTVGNVAASSLFFGVMASVLLLGWSMLRYTIRVKPCFSTVHLLTLPHLIGMAAVGLHCVSLLSNSFILYEGDVICFLVQSLVLSLFLWTLKRLTLKGNPVFNTRKVLVLLVPFVLLSIAVRVSKWFFSCRDFQVGCTPPSLTLSIAFASHILGPSLGFLRFSLSCLLTCAVPVFMAALVPAESYQYLNPWLARLLKIGLPLAAFCTCTFWAIEGLQLELKGVLLPWQRVILPRLVCALCGGGLVVGILHPYNSSRLHSAGPQKVTVQAVISLVFIVALWVPITLLLNDGIALSSVIMVLQAVTLLWVTAKYDLRALGWPVVAVWMLMSCQYFYGLGHTPTVTSLRFEAAFTGIYGDINAYNLPIAALMVALNTVASQVLFAFGLPLLVLLNKDHSKNSLTTNLLTTSLQYTALHSAKMLVTVLAASIHRRHLMIWGVFSPRFMYEGAFQVTTDLCILFVYTLFTRSPVND